MQCILKQQAQKNPKLPALITAEGIQTYEELDKHIDEWIDNNPLKSFAPAVFFDPSIIELFGAWRQGSVVCLQNTRLPENMLQEMKKRFQSIQIQAPLATCMLTSGSSNQPKIAAHTYENLYYSALGANEIMPLKPNMSRWLLSLPRFHVGGIAILFRSFLAGAAVVQAPLNWENLIKYKITHLSLVPTQLKRLIESKPKANFLKAVLIGGASCPKELIDSAKDLPIHLTYGSTEMSSQIFTDGIVLPYRELKLALDGELLVRGKTLFYGYWEERGWVFPFDNEGWFATGDLAEKKEGKWKILKRKDSLIISGGENIQPGEIKKALLSLPGVLEVKIGKIADDEFGERPIAFLKGEWEEKKIREALEKKLPRYKIPKFFKPLIDSWKEESLC